MDDNIIVLRHNQATHVKIHTYPDGQHNVEIDIDNINVKKPVRIKCSIRNFGELEILLCIVAALRKNDFYVSVIEYLYLFGMRSDRSFAVGMPNYFKDVVAPIINGLDIPSKLLQPHSFASSKYINNNFSSIHIEDELINFPDNIIIIGGDKSFEFEKYIISRFSKKRCDNGNIEVSLLEQELVFIKNYPTQDIMIADDLCDGGATFIAESQYIKKFFPHKKLYLFVAHALFTKGIDHVAQWFDHIYCTNSYQDINHPKVTQFKVI